jgi:hypothetical protein
MIQNVKAFALKVNHDEETMDSRNRRIKRRGNAAQAKEKGMND